MNWDAYTTLPVDTSRFGPTSLLNFLFRFELTSDVFSGDTDRLGTVQTISKLEILHPIAHHFVNPVTQPISPTLRGYEHLDLLPEKSIVICLLGQQ